MNRDIAPYLYEVLLLFSTCIRETKFAPEFLLDEDLEQHARENVAFYDEEEYRKYIGLPSKKGANSCHPLVLFRLP